MESQKITKCRVCSSSALLPILDLGDQPWCNGFIAQDNIFNEKRYPLNLVFCAECRTPQIDFTVPKEIMFSDHVYLSGSTKTMQNHFYETALEATLAHIDLAYTDLIVDIGGNDGTQLLQYKKFTLLIHCNLFFKNLLVLYNISLQIK